MIPSAAATPAKPRDKFNSKKIKPFNCALENYENGFCFVMNFPVFGFNKKRRR
jgi:hypothetical protein